MTRHEAVPVSPPIGRIAGVGNVRESCMAIANIGTFRSWIPKMRRMCLLPLLSLSSFALSGCVAGLAASAVGTAVSAATAEDPITEDLRRPAVNACTARAEEHGEVRIIDAELHPDNRVTVWGTVQDAQQRRSFECRYNGEVRTFRLREIRAR
jgi:hypothetical protein